MIIKIYNGNFFRYDLYEEKLQNYKLKYVIDYYRLIIID